MNNRGIAITLITIILVLPLIVLIHGMSEAVRSTQTTAVTTDGGTKALYYYDDIVTDYKDIIGISVSTTTIVNGTVWVNFTGIGTLTPTRQKRITDYTEFITNEYSKKLNLELNVTNPPLAVNISKYHYRLVIGDQLYFTSGDDVSEQWRNVAEMIFSIVVNQTHEHQLTNESPVDNGQIQFTASIKGSDGIESLSKTSAFMKPNGNNQPFLVTFDDGSFARIDYEKYNESDGTLYTTTSGVEVNVTGLAVRFKTDNTTPEFVADAVITLKQQGNINKSRNVVISDESSD